MATLYEYSGYYSTRCKYLWKGEKNMNKKMKIGLILATYAILAGIPSVLGYLQYDRGESTQYGGGSCGTCHVVPNGSPDISFSNKTDQVPDPNAIAWRTPQGTENPPIFEETHKQKN